MYRHDNINFTFLREITDMTEPPQPTQILIVINNHTVI